MKAYICFECHRFFDDSFIFCPYCGNKLKQASITEEKESEETKAIVKKVEEKDQNFYDSLSSWEKLFVNDFYNEIKDECPLLEMKHVKSYTCFVRELDKVVISSYAHWFFFTRKDGKLALKYRSSPTSKETPKTIVINRNMPLERAVNTIIPIIRRRIYGKEELKKNDSVSINDFEEKKLPPRPQPKSVFLTGYGMSSGTSGIEGNKRKTQKEVWNVKRTPR